MKFSSNCRATPEGLTKDEAVRRLAEHGLNELTSSHRVSPWKLLFEQFKNVLIIILLVAIVLSALLDHGVEAIAIAVIVLFSVILGFVQEYRAEKAIEALKQMAAPTATALRDGEETEVAARDLVPGDVILLRAGDRIPADARLIEAINLQVEEAVLTGESLPVEKHTAPTPEGRPGGWRPEKHGLQRHGCLVWSRAGCSGRNRNEHRVRENRQNAANGRDRPDSAARKPG